MLRKNSEILKKHFSPEEFEKLLDSVTQHSRFIEASIYILANTDKKSNKVFDSYILYSITYLAAYKPNSIDLKKALLAAAACDYVWLLELIILRNVVIQNKNELLEIARREHSEQVINFLENTCLSQKVYSTI